MPAKNEPAALPTLEFNLTESVSYKASLKNLRLQLGPAEPGSVTTSEIIEVKVLVKGEGVQTTTVNLFMLAANRYVIGFRGHANTVFALEDSNPNPKRFQQMLEGVLGQNIKLAPLKVSHAELGTYNTYFGIGVLSGCRFLSEYQGGDVQKISRPLALLVCMIAEGSRFTSVGGQCAELLNGKMFRADKLILTNFGNALLLKKCAAKAGLTLEQFLALRANIAAAKRKVLYALAGARIETSLAGILNALYGNKTGKELPALRDQAFVKSDVNLNNALETLLTEAPKLIGVASANGRRITISVEQVKQICEVVNLLSDDTVARAAANLA